MAILAYFVGYVVRLRSEKEMLGVDATHHVAFVKNVQPVGYWPVIGDPIQTMGQNGLTLVAGRPVSIRIDPAKPDPAPVFIHVIVRTRETLIVIANESGVLPPGIRL